MTVRHEVETAPSGGTQVRALRNAGVCGLAAAALYVTATVGGALTRPGYSHVRDAISALTASHAPHRGTLAILYVAYNILLVGMAAGLRRAWPESRPLRAAAALFVVSAAAGVGQVTAFPQDSTGTPATSAGAAHIALAGVSAVLTVVCAVLYGLAFRRIPGRRAASVASFAVAAALLVAGPVAAASVGGPYLGLFERVTIGSFLAWVTGVSAGALRWGAGR